MLPFTLILGAYVLGSIPFAILVSRWRKGIDVRDYGSGNMGATNVLRVVGKGAGGLTLLADMGKGLVPVLLARALELSPAEVGLVALATVLGHLYPIFVGFRGGKGVATGLGAFLGMMPLATLLAVGVWAICLALSRYVSLSSILASLSLPLIALFFSSPQIQVVFAAVIALLVSYRHRENAQRLLAGTEEKIGARNGLEGESR